MPGPVPKRSTHRRRRGPRIEQLDVVGEVVVPTADESWHPLAKDWFESLAESGQCRYYEPSDWQQARIWAEVLSKQLQGRLSSRMMAVWLSAAAELLTTEGARRRVRVEVNRRALSVVDQPVVDMSEYRDL